MRRRLLITPVLVALVATTLFGLPILILGHDFLQQSRTGRLELDAQRAATMVDRARQRGVPVRDADIDSAVRPGVRVVVERDGTPIARVGPRAEGGVLSASTPTLDSTLVVRTYEPDAGLDSEVRTLWLAVAGFGVIAILVAIAVGVWLARRLSQPLEQLAEVAERLGSGDPRPQGQRYGMAELDRVAEVLDNSATRLSAMLAAERRLAQDASHQIRTPLTALSMRLEEILAAESAEDAHEEAGQALSQAERLADVVDRLLSAGSTSEGVRRLVVNVDEAVHQQVEEWRPAYDAAHRHAEVTGEQGLEVIGSPGTLAHVVATLLENALRHGAGKVVLHTRTTGGGSVVVEVSDQGPGVPAELGQRIFERAVSGRSGTGLGLALARDLAEADGGRLELVSRKPAVFAVFLPRWRDDTIDPVESSEGGNAGPDDTDNTGEGGRGTDATPDKRSGLAEDD